MDDLPTRAATAADAPAIHRLVAACERDLDGTADSSLDDIVADLGRPAINLARDTLLVTGPDGELAGWAWVHLGRRARVDVHPGYRRRGIGTRLLGWAEECARERGSERLGQNVSDADTEAAALLRAHDYAAEATSWLLEIPLAAPPGVPAPPAGVTVRGFRPGDAQEVYRLIEDAFAEWGPGRRRRPYDEWAQYTVGRDTFVPDRSPVALVGDRLVGAVLSLDQPDTDEGLVHQVAVHRDHRNRGIARALLGYAFRGFHEDGRRACVLWTHTDTDALSLYQRLGMTVQRSATHFSRPLFA